MTLTDHYFFGECSNRGFLRRRLIHPLDLGIVPQLSDIVGLRLARHEIFDLRPYLFELGRRLCRFSSTLIICQPNCVFTGSDICPASNLKAASENSGTIWSFVK